jgi:hypothetical protein
LNGVGEILEVWADRVRALFGFIEGKVVEEICVVGKQQSLSSWSGGQQVVVCV